LACVATILAVGLHILFGVSAGALWRDEVNSLELATVRTLGELWTNLDYDSFPALFFLVLRQVAGVPSEISDSSLRVFGVTIGLLILGALWLNARLLRLGVPLVSLALIGFNPMVIRYGDSVRGYGLGILLMLLTIGGIWKVTEAPNARRVILAAFAAVLSVQCLYYNSIMLFAVCVGGTAVTIRRRLWRRTVLLLGIGALAAVSLLPYLPTIKRVQAWNFQFKGEINFAFLWDSLSETLGSPVSATNWIWVGLLALSIVVAVTEIWRKTDNTDAARARHDCLLFASVMLVVGTFGYAGFLRLLSYFTQPWYFVLLLAFVATSLEIIFASSSSRIFATVARGVFVALFIGLTVLPSAQVLRMPQTNMDLIAGRLHSLAKKDDLILINTWNYGISFRRYYRDATPWTTIPPMEDLRFHRCDLAKRQMMSPDALVGVRQQIGETLRRGNDVWLVGTLSYVTPGQEPLLVPPGYDGPDGWIGSNFYPAWSQQTSYFLQKHIVDFERVVVPRTDDTMKFENLPLSRFHGYRENVEYAARID
jgi:hypothetical protein